MKIAIIGSGLAAVSAAKVLVKRGVKPVILDVGENLDAATQSIVNRMSSLVPQNWCQKDLQSMSSNPSINAKGKHPIKLAFGSDYFYADSNNRTLIEDDGTQLPFSHAKGGFSVGWGAAALPPADCDLSNWPIKMKDLGKYFKNILQELPYSACDDNLSKHFSIFSNNLNAIRLTPGNSDLLIELEKKIGFYSDEISFGQARLLVQASDSAIEQGCKYCGYCMSGCVYDCIYKASKDIDRMVSENTINYVSNVMVYSLEEKGNIVRVGMLNKHGQHEVCEFDRIFLAAGAVGSSRIVMQSKQIYEQEVRLLSTVGFILPMLRIKRSPILWPLINTQAGLFLEYKVANLSNHWIHTQLSTPNEIVLEKLGIRSHEKGALRLLKIRFAEHLMIAHCNMHSDHANGYILKLEKSDSEGLAKLFSRREEIPEPYIAIKFAAKKLFSIARKVNCYPIPFLMQNSIKFGSFHLGGTLPMTENPQRSTDTNLLGIPKNWSRIHVIDSSIFPSLPGTTIGLLAMANAARIATETELN